MVVIGGFPHQEQMLWGMLRLGQDSGHIFATAMHLVAFTGDMGTRFEADVIDVFAASRGVCVLFDQELGMGQGELVESRMAFEGGQMLARAVAVDLVEGLFRQIKGLG